VISRIALFVWHRLLLMGVALFGLVLVLLLSSRVDAQGLPRLRTFEEAGDDTPNPDRGLFKQYRSNNQLLVVTGAASRNVRIHFDLSAFIDAPISAAAIRNLDAALANLEKHKQRSIVRFIYDYPSDMSALKLRSARTASPSLMSTHIRQIGPVLSAHGATVFAVETGLIGFWGEQHGDIGPKRSPDAVAFIANKWRAALGKAQILTLIRYRNVTAARGFDRSGAASGKLGFWNDCLGANDDPAVNNRGLHVVEGETCALPAKVDYSCKTMLEYFASANLDLLHGDYYGPILNRFRNEGCLPVIKRDLGYRYVIRAAEWVNEGSAIRIRIDNAGWGRSHISRPLYLMSGRNRLQQIADLRDFAPNSKNVRLVHLDKPVPRLGSPLELRTADGVQFSNTAGNSLSY
jgi:hypothetical protein